MDPALERMLASFGLSDSAVQSNAPEGELQNDEERRSTIGEHEYRRHIYVEFKPPSPSLAAVDTPQASSDHDQMTAPSREELDAKFALVREQVRGDNEQLRTGFAELRGDFARSSQQTTEAIAALAISVADLKGAVSATQGSIDGVKTAVSASQFAVTTRITVFATVMTVALAIVGIALAWAQLRIAAQAPSTPSPPIIIQVPAPTQATVPAANPAGPAASPASR